MILNSFPTFDPNTHKFRVVVVGIQDKTIVYSMLAPDEYDTIEEATLAATAANHTMKKALDNAGKSDDVKSSLGKTT